MAISFYTVHFLWYLFLPPSLLLIYDSRSHEQFVFFAVFEFHFFYIHLMSDSHLPKKLILFVLIEPLQKWRKVLFVSPEQFLLFLRYLDFYPDFLVIKEHNLIRKRRLVSEFMKYESMKHKYMKNVLLN